MPNLIQCEIATGISKGDTILLPRISLRAPESSGYPFQFQRMQFPIKLCFAMTVNKSQGQTLQEVGIYIRQPCFSHGQLYVAFSRARKASKIWVVDENSQNDCSQPPRTTNVVSYDLLKKAGIIPGLAIVYSKYIPQLLCLQLLFVSSNTILRLCFFSTDNDR